MSSKVYANGMEVSGKASGHKVLGSMPDVCLSPPSPPAGPIPIPYPNFAQASDTTGGSKTVKAGKKEIDLKGKSKYKKCKGDEAATRSFGGSVLSHTITGAIKYVAGSFDVKVEGSSVVRTLDFTTGNHTNPTSGSVGPGVAGVAPPSPSQKACMALNEDRSTAESNDLNEPVSAGYTHAVGQIDGKLMKGVSHDEMLKNPDDNGYSRPKERPPRINKKKQPFYRGCLKDKKHHHTSANHAEARMMEELISKGTTGKLMLSIKWHPTDAVNTKPNPCGTCNNLMCEAKACGLEVTYCDGKTEKKPNC